MRNYVDGLIEGDEPTMAAATEQPQPAWVAGRCRKAFWRQAPQEAKGPTAHRRVASVRQPGAAEEELMALAPLRWPRSRGRAWSSIAPRRCRRKRRCVSRRPCVRRRARAGGRHGHWFHEANRRCTVAGNPTHAGRQERVRKPATRGRQRVQAGNQAGPVPNQRGRRRSR